MNAAYKDDQIHYKQYTEPSFDCCQESLIPFGNQQYYIEWKTVKEQLSHIVSSETPQH